MKTKNNQREFAQELSGDGIVRVVVAQESWGSAWVLSGLLEHQHFPGFAFWREEGPAEKR